MSDLIKTLIIDDEPNARQAIRKMLSVYCRDVRVVGEAEGVVSGLEAILKFEPELLLLDVEMQDGTGFDLLKKLKEIDFGVIFITAHEHYALNAIKFSALDYILKPINPNDLVTAVEKAVKSRKEDMILKLKSYAENTEEVNRPPRKIVLNTATNVYVINVEEILRCESDENYTQIHFLDRDKIIVSKTLKEFDELLSPYGFFRVHQSHLINMACVDSYIKGLGGIVVMKNKEKVPVSARRKETFLKRLSG